MTVDKPPLALWVQALSARVFGLSSWSMLVPQALMGVATVGLAYDLVRRRFGRPAGFVGGLALAVTPVWVAIARYNNPDTLLVLCCVAAVWFVVRGLEDGRTRWIVLAGVSGGPGFEGKMGAALLIVPALAVAWVWVAPAGRSLRGHLGALRQLLWGGLAMAVVGLAWPVLVWLTPASDRPWISGTSDNDVWSLILGYNGLGRLLGQSGGAGGGGGGARGGGGGPARGRRGGGGGLGGGSAGRWWRRRPVRRLAGRAAALEREPRRSGRVVARCGAGRRHRHRGRFAPAAQRCADRLGDCRRRLLRDDRGGVQHRERDLPPVLHLPARALRGRAGRCGRRLARPWRAPGGAVRNRGHRRRGGVRNRDLPALGRRRVAGPPGHGGRRPCGRRARLRRARPRADGAGRGRRRAVPRCTGQVGGRDARARRERPVP